MQNPAVLRSRLHEQPTLRPPDPPDDRLLSQVAAGDEGAFRMLWERFGAAVYSLCLRRLSEPGAAEDAAQEAFVNVWRHARSFDPQRGSAAAWLFAVTRNAAAQVARKASRRELALTVLPDDPVVHEEHTLLRLAVHAALTRIPTTERQVLELAYFDDLSQSQIATRLDLPLGTVKSRTRAGLKRMAELLEEMQV